MLLGLLLLASSVGAAVEGADLGLVPRSGGAGPAQEATQYEKPTCLRNQTEVIYFPHETECHLFYSCANGVLTLMECPPNTEFVPGIDLCDWIVEGGCTLGPATTEETETTGATEATGTIETTDATETSGTADATTEMIETTETSDATHTTHTTEANETTDATHTTETTHTIDFETTSRDWRATPPRAA